MGSAPFGRIARRPSDPSAMHALHAEKMDTAESRVCAATGQNGFPGVDHGVRAIAPRPGLLPGSRDAQFARPLNLLRHSGRLTMRRAGHRKRRGGGAAAQAPSRTAKRSEMAGSIITGRTIITIVAACAQPVAGATFCLGRRRRRTALPLL